MCNGIVKFTNNIATNVTSSVSSTVPTNCDDKKVRYKMDNYILHIVLLVIMLPF